MSQRPLRSTRRQPDHRPFREDRPLLRPTHGTCSRDPEGHLPTDEWTYFHVHRCVHGMLEQDGTARPPDVDAVLDIALRRVQKGRSSVVSPDRYAGWVAVVCRNAYLNFVRTRQGYRVIHDSDAIDDPRTRAGYGHDARILQQALLEAIERLPRFLQEVARLRFAENCGYPVIATRTGKATPIVRSYVNKATQRLRMDARLMRVLAEWRG